MAQRIRELNELRTENSKHWLFDDGKIEATVGIGYPLHFEDAQGNLQDIDTNWEFESGFGYKVKKTKYHLRLFQNRMRFGFDKNVFVDYLIEDLAIAITIECNRAIAFDKWLNTDIEFIAHEKGIKTNIILKDGGHPFSFAIPLKAVGCTVVQEEDLILFKDDDIILGYTLLPFMVDAKGAIGKIAIKFDGDSVIYTPNLDFIAKAEYPIKIDPSINLYPSTDTYISSYAPTTSYSTNTYMQIGRGSSSSYIYRSLMQFDLSGIPSSAVISDAILNIAGINSTGSASVTVHGYIYKVTSPWSSNVTWNTQPTIDTGTIYGTASFQFIEYMFDPVWQSVNLLTLVNLWRSGTPDYGIEIRGTETGNNYGCTLGSNESSSTKPYLTITYNRPPSTPTGLTPGGSSGSDTYINNVTPMLSWIASDPDGDTQAKYQVLIYRTNDDSLIKDSGQVWSSITSYAVPANTLTAGVSYYWKVQTADASGSWSGYSSAVYIYTNRAPSASSLSPGNISSPFAENIQTLTPQLKWTYSDPDSNTQGGYELYIYRASDNAQVYTSGQINSNNTYHNLPAGDLVWGVKYYWKVRVQDSYGYWGSYASVEYILPLQILGYIKFQVNERIIQVPIVGVGQGGDVSVRLKLTGSIGELFIVQLSDSNATPIRIQTNKGVRAIGNPL